MQNSNCVFNDHQSLSVEEGFQGIRGIASGRAPGMYRVHIGSLKTLHALLKELLSVIFNVCLCQSFIPRIISDISITPIIKNKHLCIVRFYKCQ